MLVRISPAGMELSHTSLAVAMAEVEAFLGELLDQYERLIVAGGRKNLTIHAVNPTGAGSWGFKSIF